MDRAMDIADYIVNKCSEDGEPISNLQLQKILYFIQRDSLRKTGKPAFAESVEAWQFGPVVPGVYYSFAHWGGSPIVPHRPKKPEIEDRERVDEIVDAERGKSVWDLVRLTHRPDGAWSQIYGKGEGRGHAIPTELIRDAG